MNRFSIILPVRNGGEYLKACINSILEQTYPAFDCFVLENQSTDGSAEWLKSIDDPRIKVVPATADLSMPANWKRALDLPMHEYVTFIGHDDLLAPDYLTQMNALIDQYPKATLYQAHFHYINSSGEFVRTCQPMTGWMEAEDFLQHQLQGTMDSMGTGYMFRSADFKKLGGFPDSYPNLLFGDYALFLQLADLSGLAISPQVLFKYRLHQSLSISTNVDLYCTAFLQYIAFLDQFRRGRPAIQGVLQAHGEQYLNFYCQSLSHRLLKADSSRRRKVGAFIEACREQAENLGVRHFNPDGIFKIRIARILDSSQLTRKLFQWVRNGIFKQKN